MVTFNKTEAQAGESIEVTIETEYTITCVYANDSECYKGEENTYTFTMPAEDVNLSIELDKNASEDTSLDITKGNIYIKDLWLEDMTGERVTVDSFVSGYINDTFTLPSLPLDEELYSKIYIILVDVYSERTIDWSNSSGELIHSPGMPNMTAGSCDIKLNGDLITSYSPNSFNFEAIIIDIIADSTITMEFSL